MPTILELATIKSGQLIIHNHNLINVVYNRMRLCTQVRVWDQIVMCCVHIAYVVCFKIISPGDPISVISEYQTANSVRLNYMVHSPTITGSISVMVSTESFVLTPESIRAVGTVLNSLQNSEIGT